MLPDGPGANPWTDQQWPKSQFIQVVREEGEADSVVDNTDEIAAYIAERGLELPEGAKGDRPHRDRDGGCSVGGDGASSAGGLALAALAALFLLRRRRRLA